MVTVHAAVSVGWMGAIAAFLALAVAALGSDDADLVPGLVQSLRTEWGLFPYYWVVVTLVINVVATAVLLLFMSGLVVRLVIDLLDGMTRLGPRSHVNAGCRKARACQ